MAIKQKQILCQKVISGGQTGIDRGALDACLKEDFPCGGWCPAGRLAEDGIIHKKYPLLETNTPRYNERTLKNIMDSDGTLIISTMPITGGTKLTADLSFRYKKPFLIISSTKSLISTVNWLFDNNIKILNVAGPRESEWPGATFISYHLIRKLIKHIRKNI